jgi:hypothetical protein
MRAALTHRTNGGALEIGIGPVAVMILLGLPQRKPHFAPK